MTRITFVGTSDAFGAGGRRQAAIWVDAGGDGILLDCAPTTGTGLAALGIPREAIDAVVISHFHADHFGGIPQLLLASVYEDRRRKPLLLAGPPGIEARVRSAARALGHDLEHLELPFALRFAEVRPGRELDLGPARLDGFEARHQPDSEPHGLALRLGRKRLVYSGDTGWFEDLPGHVEGADLFVCECTFHDHDFEYHLSYRKLLGRRASLRCDRLVLTHLGAEMAERRGRLELETADDGLVLEL